MLNVGHFLFIVHSVTFHCVYCATSVCAQSPTVQNAVLGAAEVAQQLRTFNALPEDVSSVPGTHV